MSFNGNQNSLVQNESNKSDERKSAADSGNAVVLQFPQITKPVTNSANQSAAAPRVGDVFDLVKYRYERKRQRGHSNREPSRTSNSGAFLFLGPNRSVSGEI